MALHLYLVRHGETTWSLTHQHTGRTDIPLTEHGEDEARELGKRLRGTTFTHAFSSPSRRAQRTCALVVPGDKPVIEPNLAEWDYGDYEGGCTWTSVKNGRIGISFETVAPVAKVPDKSRTALTILLFVFEPWRARLHCSHMVSSGVYLPPDGSDCR